MDDCGGTLPQTHARRAAHLLLDFLDVIEIVSERRVDAGESDGRNVGDDLVGSHALMLMPHYDIEHTNAVASDASFAAADAGRPGDPVVGGRGHDSSINRVPATWKREYPVCDVPLQLS
jgi:hypothetical protein